MAPEAQPLVRIGELSRRTGIGADTLRAWERRYGLLAPQRSDGGFRLYGPRDEERVRAMKSLIDSGMSAGEAARLASEARPATGSPEGGAGDTAGRLQEAFERFDEAAANAILDDSLGRLTSGAALDQVVLPAIRGVGERWRKGELSVAHEHFATGLLRGRMLAVARNWGAGVGPLALLACPPGERHDLGLIAFGVALHDRGWRITYLGADTPIEEIARASAQLKPAAVVLAALVPAAFERVEAGIVKLAADTRLLVAGEGASEELATRLGATLLDPDPVRAAAELAPRPGQAA